MTLSIELCNNKELWDNFVSVSLQGNIFCTTQFLDAWCQDYELLLVTQKEQILLGAIVAKKDNQPVNIPFMYHGVLLSASVTNSSNHKRVNKSLELVGFLLTEIEKRYDRISFSLHHSFKDLRSFQWFHYHNQELGRFKIEVIYTGILDLSNSNEFESILMNARTVRRQEYRRALREGFTVEESREVEVLDYLHELTFKRQGIARSDGEKNMANRLALSAISNRFGRLLIAKDKFGNPASAALFLFDNQCGYYLIGANHPEYRNTGVGTYVLFEQIRICMEKGISTVDFVGINSPNRGDFKTSFNAIPMPYFTVKWEKPSFDYDVKKREDLDI